ncbi:hypothetical protein JAAARDRAFT_51389 [Jaapia argillacea MUCL 33604]|uniref:Uncharacterized protein n=1 Tax=Jaapia argillacea MUCL 33604 TaxID=933084 RepID=A0A067P5H9_9AGAM|nr:hypothetical protein JAAARDRAFT_51389 [Jaapia argillacea MUCL 33604]
MAPYTAPAVKELLSEWLSTHVKRLCEETAALYPGKPPSYDTRTKQWRITGRCGRMHHVYINRGIHNPSDLGAVMEHVGIKLRYHALQRLTCLLQCTDGCHKQRAIYLGTRLERDALRSIQVQFREENAAKAIWRAREKRRPMGGLHRVPSDGKVAPNASIVQNAGCQLPRQQPSSSQPSTLPLSSLSSPSLKPPASHKRKRVTNFDGMDVLEIFSDDEVPVKKKLFYGLNVRYSLDIQSDGKGSELSKRKGKERAPVDPAISPERYELRYDVDNDTNELVEIEDSEVVGSPLRSSAR